MKYFDVSTLDPSAAGVAFVLFLLFLAIAWTAVRSRARPGEQVEMMLDIGQGGDSGDDEKRQPLGPLTEGLVERSRIGGDLAEDSFFLVDEEDVCKIQDLLGRYFFIYGLPDKVYGTCYTIHGNTYFRPFWGKYNGVPIFDRNALRVEPEDVEPVNWETEIGQYEEPNRRHACKVIGASLSEVVAYVDGHPSHEGERLNPPS